MRHRVALVNTIFSVRTHNKQSLNIKLPQLCGTKTNKGVKMKLKEAIEWVDGTLETYQYIREDDVPQNDDEDGTIQNEIDKTDEAWSLIRMRLHE